MAIAAITVMLFIVWSDMVRQRPPAPVLSAMRVALFLIVSGIFILNAVRYPHMFPGSARALAGLAALVGVAGAAYFGRKLVRRA